MAKAIDAAPEGNSASIVADLEAAGVIARDLDSAGGYFIVLPGSLPDEVPGYVRYVEVRDIAPATTQRIYRLIPA